MYFFFNDTATTEIYTYLHTLSLHDALPISSAQLRSRAICCGLSNAPASLPNIALRSSSVGVLDRATSRFGGIRLCITCAGVMILGRWIAASACRAKVARSEEHTSELQSLMRISYAVFCLQKKKQKSTN